MRRQNRFAPLLSAAADRYREHESDIARNLLMALSYVLDSPVAKSPKTSTGSDDLSTVLQTGGDPLIDLINEVAPLLCWALPGRGRAPTELVSHIAVVEIVGPDGMINCDTCRFGLLLQSPGSLYPEHHHAAEELYLILSGTAKWGTDRVGTALQAPGTFIHHVKWQPHHIRTQSSPLLAMWGWSGDLEISTYSML
jgi:dimethylpropiothetin dethiomethylase